MCYSCIHTVSYKGGRTLFDSLTLIKELGGLSISYVVLTTVGVFCKKGLELLCDVRVHLKITQVIDKSNQSALCANS